MSKLNKSALFDFTQALLKSGKPGALVEIKKTSGSTPRPMGAIMVVGEADIEGSIGGGRLEFMAIEAARKAIANKSLPMDLDIPLGPEIGQCCGGRVYLHVSLIQQNTLATLATNHAVPILGHVQIDGAGHTGHALARALALLPFEVVMVDTRKEELRDIPSAISINHTPLPEKSVHAASAHTAFVIFTHEHHLDFLIAAESLSRGDAAYVGMIGSRTKRAVFEKWMVENGYERKLCENLTCPIGGKAVHDKRPEVIAALVAAELLHVFGATPIAQTRE